MKNTSLENFSIKPKFFLLPNTASFVPLFILIFSSIILTLLLKDWLPFFFRLIITLYFVYLYLLYMKRVYQNTIFILSKDKIEYSGNYLLFKESRTIKTSEIREISESQNVLQEKYSIGSITLHTRITNLGELVIKDVANHKELASRIREICGL
jgi:hypothetical protein